MSDFFAAPFLLIAILATYVALSFFLHRLWAQFLFGLSGPMACFLIFYRPLEDFPRRFFVTYVALAVVALLLLRIWRGRAFFPVVLLLLGFLTLNRLGSWLSFADWSVSFGSWIVPWVAQSGVSQTGVFVGLSYFCFRLILLATEIRANPELRPGFFQTLGFAFFLPHFVVGPISPFQGFARSFRGPRPRPWESVQRALVRLVLGLTKFFFLSGLFYQLTFTRLHLRADQVSAGQFLVSVLAYSFYIYLNFSGFCDVMIAVAFLCGIESAENFQNPLAARNLREFWKRWHISLTDFLQTLIFNPLIKFLAQKMRIPFTAAAIMATFVVFTVIGLWHGFETHYLLFSLLHASGLAALSLWPKGLRWPRGLAVFFNFVYVSFCFFFFENETSFCFEVLGRLFHIS